MKNRVLVTALAVFLPFLPSLAQADYQQELIRLDADALDFFQVDGFAEVNEESLTGEDYYSSRQFPALAGGHPSISWPDADLDALTRAVLLLDAQEEPLPHVRYLLHYSMNISPDYPELQHDYVEVTRFNLGPERRRDVLEYVAEEHVASLAEFGIGPHVSWRFAMAPIMGMQAALIYVSRKEVSDSQAQATDCLGQSCLALTDVEGPSSIWNPLDPPSLEPAPYHDKSPQGSTRAARIVQELWAGLSSDGMDALPYRPGQPQFVFVSSVDVSGQEAAASGLAQQTVVLDDSIKEVWTRRDEAAGTQAQFMQTYIPRR